MSARVSASALRAINPKSTYKHALGLKRIEYAKQVQLKEEAKRQSSIQLKEAEEAKKRALAKDIKEFKAQQKIQEFMVFKTDSLTQQKEQGEAREQLRKERRQQHLKYLQSKSQSKIDSMLALFHSASDVITSKASL
jgi:4-alpha-glucanotransferase